MKICKLFIVALAAMAVISCSKDNEPSGGKGTGEKEKAHLVIRISQPSAPATYASTTTENAVTGEIEFAANDVTIVIIDKAADAVESITTVAGATLAGNSNKTAAIEISSGEKYVYALMNTITGTDSDIALGMTRAAFETKVITLADYDDISQTGEFVITNIETPQAFMCKPESELALNEVKIEVGRVAAKIYAEFDAPLSAQTGGGTLTDVEFRVAGIPLDMYRIGQFDNGQLKVPNYTDGQITGTPPASDHYDTYYTKSAYTTMEDKINNVTAASTIYTVENSHDTPMSGNVTRLIVKGNYHPDVIVDGSDGTTPATYTPGTTFWVVTMADNSIVYCDSDPTAAGWPDGGPGSIVEYEDGICYYNKVWIADNSEQDSKKYSVIRNHFYRVGIKYVNGIGTPKEDEDIDPTDPLELKSKLEVEVEVLPWSLIEQTTGLEGQ